MLAEKEFFVKTIIRGARNSFRVFRWNITTRAMNSALHSSETRCQYSAVLILIPERGHSCPQQRGIVRQASRSATIAADKNVRAPSK
jgi:hypothetical protein